LYFAAGASAVDLKPGLDWALKVWYPRQRMPKVLRPYQQGEPSRGDGREADYDAVEVHRRDQLDADWGRDK
jgi:hypothetical protein